METVEQLAPATIAELIPKLTQLTTYQPPTTEIEDALLTSKAITRAIFEWLGSRYSAQAQARVATETPAEAEELDRIERAHPIVLGLPA